jgi:acyl carrier protein
MSELSDKLERLSDTDRVRLYRELLDRSGETPPPSVKELVLVYEEGSAATPEVLRDAAKRLPEHERPARFIAIGSLPRSEHGKLDRRGLPGLVRREQPASQPFDETQFGADSVMSSAVATFGKVLGEANVGPDSNFFELGGHSLLAVDCILEFEESTGERISITEFLNHPTPRGIAALLK